MAEFRRVRPMLGTYLSITLAGVDGAEDVHFAKAFAEAARLEMIFSRHRTDSHLMRLNRAGVDEAIEVEKELCDLLTLALDLWRSSSGAFSPFGQQILSIDSAPLFLTAEPLCIACKLQPVTLDLDGIAKGFVVDRVAALLAHTTGLSGSVNAGGDLRFFNSTGEQTIELRLGTMDQPVLRPIVCGAKSLATSSPTLAQGDSNSSTRYPLPLRTPLTAAHSAVAFAQECAHADALTKIALFGEPAAIERCAQQLGAGVMVFDSVGKLCESYGLP